MKITKLYTSFDLNQREDLIILQNFEISHFGLYYSQTETVKPNNHSVVWIKFLIL